MKPAAFSVAFASASVWPVTSGSGVVCGPFETERLTVEPLVAVDEPLGTWLTTIPAGWSLSTSVRPTAKPAAWSCCSAVE